MPRPRSLVFRVLVAVAILGVVPALLSSLVPAGGGPYSSSLSLPAVAPAHAVAYCNDKACAGGSRHNIVCAKVVGFHCENLPGRFCTSNACP